VVKSLKHETNALSSMFTSFNKVTG